MKKIHYKIKEFISLLNLQEVGIAAAVIFVVFGLIEVLPEQLTAFILGGVIVGGVFGLVAFILAIVVILNMEAKQDNEKNHA